MGLLKLSRNRVWRTYTGGKMIDSFFKSEVQEDGHKPEVWVSSVTEANNPEKVENEGLSFIENSSKTLKDEINSNPTYYLGSTHIEKHGSTPGILVKILDAAERLTIQVHPNKDKALSLFNSQFGKTEAWYILDSREINGEKPHIYFGFKKGITQARWKEVFETQNIPEMLGLMNKVNVKQGDIFLIEGGIPHAIGAGCFILEIQEPTDLTIRTERTTPGGYEIPDQLLHQNIGFDKMFQCFNYQGYNIDEMDRWILSPKDTDKKSVKKLIGYENTKCFSLEEISLNNEEEFTNNGTFTVLLCLEGGGQISCGNDIYNINKGDQFFIPAMENNFTIKPQGSVKLVKCLPPA